MQYFDGLLKLLVLFRWSYERLAKYACIYVILFCYVFHTYIVAENNGTLHHCLFIYFIFIIIVLSL